MSSKHQDLWLWAFLGVFGFYAARAVHMQLRAMRAAARITRINKPQDNVNEAVENGLKIETLWQLTRSPNREIRAASIKIIADRASKELTYDLMLDDIAGEDSKRREKALTCVNFIYSCTEKFPAPLYKTYQATFTCLRNLHSEMHAFETALRKTIETTGPGTSRRIGIRKKPCRDALNIIAALLQQNCRDAVESGLMYWLIEYPFGGYDSPEEKKKILKEITSWYCEDPAMQTILSFALANVESREKLLTHGLIDGVKDWFEGEEVDSGWMSSGPVDNVAESAIPSTMRGGRRMREESIEEQALRRRRREAMVLGEIGRPIERTDIIERRNTIQEPEETGREQEEPAIETNEDENVREPSWWNWRPW
ncbi:hypothetical protein MMC07_006888 [Pseudocyphellaria aurata]|nr:hypothetical protein [Pseudocyphellaria aurata]